MTQRDVIVVGGGVIGLACAHELAVRGHSVELFDASPFEDWSHVQPGAEEASAARHTTSWAATGILPAARMDTATDPLDRLRGYSHGLFPGLCTRLSEATGIDLGFDRCGGFFLADTPGERAAMIGATQYWGDLEIQCEPVDLSDLVRREPGLARWAAETPQAAAWWVPDECQIRPPRLLKALQLDCQRLGVTVRRDKVDDALQRPGGVGSVRCGDRWSDADRVVLCGGAWTGGIADRLRLRESLIPVRGQILLMHHHRRLFDAVVNLGNRYLVCRDDGYVLVGSSEEEVGFDPGTTPEILDDLREFALALAPELADAAVTRAWSGFRPQTFDGFPMIGHVPNCPSLMVAAGHYRSGIHLSLATAEIIADLAESKTPPVDIESFRVGKQQNHQH